MIMEQTKPDLPNLLWCLKYAARSGGVSRAAKGADCKSAGLAFVGSSPTSPTNHFTFMWNSLFPFGDAGKPGGSEPFSVDLRSGRRETGYGFRYFKARSGTSKFSMQNSDGSLRADFDPNPIRPDSRQHPTDHH